MNISRAIKLLIVQALQNWNELCNVGESLFIIVLSAY